MTEFVERLVQKWTEVAPLETAVSTLVAGVLETTATRLAGGALAIDEEEPGEVEA